jgi:hypothetical protein
MIDRELIRAGALVASLMVTIGNAWAADEARYPDWGGQWDRFVVPGISGQPSHDQTKPGGFGQQAPLTEESAKILRESLADQHEGGLGNFPTSWGRASGMPYMMMAFGPMEWVVTPRTTYILIGWHDHFRRIFTDGRDWPDWIEPSFAGYSIGKWADEDGDGVYDTLIVETRGFRGPRSIDETGMPLHADNQSIFKERMYRDKADPKILHVETTIIDNAFTRPWTVDKKYVLNPDPRPVWTEFYTQTDNPHVKIGKESYFLSADGDLMPAKKNQAPPDLRYFNQPQK